MIRLFVKKPRAAGVFFMKSENAATVFTDDLTPDPTADPAHRRDDALMALAAQNDADAFGCLVRAHEGRVSRFVLRVLSSDRDAAQDVTQETFLRVWRSRAEYVPTGAFSSYLLRIAHRLCLDAARKAARQNAVLDVWSGTWDTADAITPSAEQTVCEQSLAEAVQDAVARLPEKERAVFVLSHYENVPYHEIARILDCPMGTVASRKHHAVLHLRRALAPWLTSEEKTE